MCEGNSDRLPFTGSQPGTWPTTQACALTGNRTGELSVCRPALNPLSHNSQGSTTVLNTSIYFNNIKAIKFNNLNLCCLLNISRQKIREEKERKEESYNDYDFT